MNEIALYQHTETGGDFWVDFSTANNCSVRRLINNPVFVFTTPKPTAETPDAAKSAESQQIVINLNMFTDRFILTFDLTDGTGSGSKYWKLYMMASNRVKVDFYYTGRSWPVTIEELSMETKPGKKDLIEGCTMTLIFTNPISFIEA